MQECETCGKKIEAEQTYAELYFCEGHPENWGSAELFFCSKKCFVEFCKQVANKKYKL